MQHMHSFSHVDEAGCEPKPDVIKMVNNLHCLLHRSQPGGARGNARICYFFNLLSALVISARGISNRKMIVSATLVALQSSSKSPTLISGNCHRMRAILSTRSGDHVVPGVWFTTARYMRAGLLPTLLLCLLPACGIAQTTSTRQVNYAGNHGFPAGAAVGCTANCGAQANTDTTLQYFDAAQVSAGNCASVTNLNTATENNPTCATSVVEAGDTIVWVFENNGLPAQHSATSGACPGNVCPPSGDGNFDTGIQQSFGATYQHTFSTAHVYPYFCLVHGSAMLGTVIVQDFSVAISNPTLAAYKSQNAAFNGVLDGLPASNPFNFSVNLSCTGASAGLTCTPPGSGVPSGGGTPVTVNASAPAGGDFTFQLQGSGLDPDGLVHTSSTATLHVIDLSLNAGLPSVTLSSNGISSTFGIGSMNAAATFPNNVALSCTGLPTGASCAFTPSASVQPNGSTQALSASVTTSGVLAGDYTVTINADPGNGLTAKMSSFTLHVRDFQYTVTPPTTVSVKAGANAVFSGKLNSLNNWAGTVTLVCQAGAPATCTPSAGVALAAGASNVAAPTITASSASNGQFNFNIQANGAPSAGSPASNQLQAVTVNVGDFTFGAASSPALTTAPGNPTNSTDFNLNTTQAGFSVNVTLTCSGLPLGASCTFFPSNTIPLSGTAQTATMTIQTTSATPVASGTTITITASGNGITHTQTVTLDVVAPVGSADMQITSFTHSPDPVLVGSKVVFTAVAKNNNGPSPASGVTLTFNVDNGGTVTSASGGTCNTASLPATCTLSSALAVNGTATFTFTVLTPFTRFMNASAQVSSTASDSNPANNIAPGQNANIRLRPLTHNAIPAKLP